MHNYYILWEFFVAGCTIYILVAYIDRTQQQHTNMSITPQTTAKPPRGAWRVTISFRSKSEHARFKALARKAKTPFSRFVRELLEKQEASR